MDRIDRPPIHRGSTRAERLVDAVAEAHLCHERESIRKLEPDLDPRARVRRDGVGRLGVTDRVLAYGRSLGMDGAPREKPQDLPHHVLLRDDVLGPNRMRITGLLKSPVLFSGTEALQHRARAVGAERAPKELTNDRRRVRRDRRQSVGRRLGPRQCAAVDSDVGEGPVEEDRAVVE